MWPEIVAGSKGIDGKCNKVKSRSLAQKYKKSKQHKQIMSTGSFWALSMGLGENQSHVCICFDSKKYASIIIFVIADDSI